MLLPAEASAPGSMMLIGEYAVLEGAPAVLMTLKSRLKISIYPSTCLCILSNLFEPYLASGIGNKPIHAVICESVLQHFFDRYDIPITPFEIRIVSEIAPTYGFASSAALVAALVKALHDFYQRPKDFRRMFDIGHSAILRSFKRGSGADLAAALADQPMIVFYPEKKEVMAFQLPWSVQAIYTGYKTPTSQVLESVLSNISIDKWRNITSDMRGCVESFIDQPQVTHIITYQSYLEAVGVACEKCMSAVKAFSSQSVAAKISGSGRGDCVIGFSEKALPALSLEKPLEFLSAEILCV